MSKSGRGTGGQTKAAPLAQDTPAQGAIEASVSEDLLAFADQLAADLVASGEEDLDEDANKATAATQRGSAASLPEPLSTGRPQEDEGAAGAVETVETVKDTSSESSKPAEVDVHEPKKPEAVGGVVLDEDSLEGLDVFGDPLSASSSPRKATTTAQESTAAFVPSLPAPPTTGRLAQKASAPSLTGRPGSQRFRLFLPGDQDLEVMYVLPRLSAPRTDADESGSDPKFLNAKKQKNSTGFIAEMAKNKAKGDEGKEN
jgi:hypothetical protein